MLSIPTMKDILVYNMLCTFYLMKLIRKNNLKIRTVETPISEEEFNQTLHRTQVGQILTYAQMTGMTQEQFLKLAVENDLATDSELEEAGYKLEEINKYER